MSEETVTTTETTDEEPEPAPTADREDVVLADGSTLDETNKLRDDADGTVELEGGKLVDAPANQPGGQFDTNAGNADTASDITGTTPIGTPANDQPDLRPKGADGNVLETPDAPATDPSVTTVGEQPELQAVGGTGDSTDDNTVAVDDNA